MITRGKGSNLHGNHPFLAEAPQESKDSEDSRNCETIPSKQEFNSCDRRMKS